jgi:hypothetical protein
MCSQDTRTFSGNQACETRFSSIHFRTAERGWQASLVEKVRIGHIRPQSAVDAEGSGHALGGDKHGRALDLQCLSRPVHRPRA